MKRLILTSAFGLATISAFAQAPFTIVRPADGARVREMVRMLVPRASVPQGGYVGIFIGGKFIEAKSADPFETDAKHQSKYFEYDLDTKGRGIPDGKLTLEAVLYVDYQSRPRIVDRTSVEVNVENTVDTKALSKDSKVKYDLDKGLKLRYKWTPGTQVVYDYSERVIQDISDAKKNELGGKPIEEAQNLNKFRIMYATDNSYSDGSGLVRVQALADKGNDSVFIHTNVAPDGERIYRSDMHPIYMLVTSTGLAKWGSYPGTMEIGGNSIAEAKVHFLVDDPLPTLPANPVKLGDSWPSRFQDGAAFDFANIYTQNNFVRRGTARGEFKGVEWEMGHPCAKIVNSLERGEKSEESQNLEKAGRNFTGNKLSEVETIWFALDKRQIIKVVRTVSFDQQVSVANNGFGGGPPSGPQNGPPPPGAPGGPPVGGRGNNDDSLPPPSFDAQGQLTPGKGGGRGGLGRAGGNGPGGGPGSGAPATAVFVRVTIEETFILEQ